MPTSLIPKIPDVKLPRRDKHRRRLLLLPSSLVVPLTQQLLLVQMETTFWQLNSDINIISPRRLPVISWLTHMPRCSHCQCPYCPHLPCHTSIINSIITSIITLATWMVVTAWPMVTMGT